MRMLLRRSGTTAHGGRPIRPWPRSAASDRGSPHRMQRPSMDPGPRPRCSISQSRRKLQPALMHPSLPTTPEAAWPRFRRTGALQRPTIRPLGHHGAASTPCLRGTDSLNQGHCRSPAASSAALSGISRMSVLHCAALRQTLLPPLHRACSAQRPVCTVMFSLVTPQHSASVMAARPAS